LSLDLGVPQICFEACGAQNALYFVVSDGDKCACGFSQEFLGADKTQVDPTSECAGDAAFTCGGPEEYELYILFDDVPVDSGAF